MTAKRPARLPEPWRGADPPDTHMRFGVAGWDYKDWAGYVYPTPLPPGFDRLAYLSQFVDCIEVNSTFYRPQPERMFIDWCRRVSNTRFRFTIKLWRRFTHEREDGSFRQDLRQVTPGLTYLQEHRKLGATLIQFPQSFHHTRDNATWVARIISALDGLRPVVEFRHVSWKARPVTDWFCRRQVGLVAIDQPEIGETLSGLIRPTNGIGYVRLHGRNALNWWRKDASVAERYDFLYSLTQLEEWQRRLLSLASGSGEIYVIANNHPRGQALINALQLQSLMTGGVIEAPPPLVAAYPDIAI